MNAEKVTKNLIEWIRIWFEENGNGCNAIIGISGGKDSTIAAKLCVEALGKDRVIGILMPNWEQKDIEDSKTVCNLLGIKYYIHNIQEAVNATLHALNMQGVKPSQQTIVNLPPRIRMSTLYAYSQSLNGRVINTCNLSETMVGYETRWGDSVGDVSPLGNLTVTELLEIGDYLELPKELVHKTPIDGLNTHADGSYVTDEDNLGVTYFAIDTYLGKTDATNSEEAASRIRTLIKNSEFKRKPIPTFKP